jgi:hypothetical protein
MLLQNFLAFRVCDEQSDVILRCLPLYVSLIVSLVAFSILSCSLVLAF